MRQAALQDFPDEIALQAPTFGEIGREIFGLHRAF
jgi:hypothetical protein